MNPQMDLLGRTRAKCFPTLVAGELFGFRVRVPVVHQTPPIGKLFLANFAPNRFVPMGHHVALESGFVVERFATFGATMGTEQLGPFTRVLEGMLQQTGVILARLSANHTRSFRQLMAVLFLDMFLNGVFI